VATDDQGDHAPHLSTKYNNPSTCTESTTVGVVAEGVKGCSTLSQEDNRAMGHKPDAPQTGRPLPCRVEDIRSDHLTVEAKTLIVEMLSLVKVRFKTNTAMIRYAMACDDKPKWALGDPGNARHLTKAKSYVSTFLGRAARQCPDWETVDWLVRASASMINVEELRPMFAGRWCAATGQPRPAGYTGVIETSAGRQPALLDPDQASDDTTRARLLGQQLRGAHARIAELESQLQAARDQVHTQQRVLAQVSTTITALRLSPPRRDVKPRVDQRVFADTAMLLQLIDTERTQTRQATRQLQRTSHYLAVLTAYLVTSCSGRHLEMLLPFDNLPIATDLHRLLRIPQSATAELPQRWLVVYLNTLLRTVDPVGAIPYDLYQLRDDGVHLDAVLFGYELPTPLLIDEVRRRYPAAGDCARLVYQRIVHNDCIPGPLPFIGTLDGLPYGERESVLASVYRAAPDDPSVATGTLRQQRTVAELLASYTREHPEVQLPPTKPVKQARKATTASHAQL
jgi:hypothetical protein